MGCDLHVYLAAKESNGDCRTIGLWSSEDDGVHELVECYLGRDYLLFGLLTGGTVRYNIPEDVPQMDEPRGLMSTPFVLPYAIASEYDTRWRGDAHSETWFSLKEIDKLHEALMIKTDDEYWKACTDSVKYFLKDINSYLAFARHYDRENVYLICWFDN